MAKGKFTGGGKPFVKGDPNIPKSPGRPKDPQEIKEAKKILKEISESLSVIYAQTAREILLKSSKEVVEIDKGKNNSSDTMLKVALSRIILKSANKGDSRNLEPILARAIGPVRQQLDVTTKDNPINATHDPQELDKLKAHLLDVLKSKQEWESQSQTSLEPPLPSSAPS